MSASPFAIAFSAFVAGAALTSGLAWVLQEDGGPRPLAGTEETLEPAGPNATKSTETAELQRTASDATARPIEASSKMEDAATSEARTALASATPGGGASMEFSLDAAIAKLYEENPERFLDMLVEQFIEDGNPRGALELLSDNEHANEWHFESVGAALKKEGDLTGAIEAYSASLRLDPMHSDGFEALAELDPSAALLIVREGLAWQPPPGNPRMRTRLAEALIAAGQTEEAKELVDALRESGYNADALSRAWMKVSPEAAEADVRAQIEKAEGNKKLAPLQKLASMLKAAGRDDEVRAIIDQILELSPRNSRARRMLMEADPAAAVEFLSQRTEAEPKNSGLWSDYGNMLLEEGRKVDAIAAWEQAVSISGHTRSVKKLLEHSPDTVWGHLETFTTNSRDDERWGDLGDLYWKNGRKDDAKRAWETAWELDNNDSEWYGKLQAVQVGRDPFR